MNKALTSQYSWADHELVLMRAMYSLLKATLEKRGLDPDRFAALEPNCTTDRIELEKRKACWVEYYLTGFAVNADIDTLLDITECTFTSDYNDTAIRGTEATLTTALAGANNDLKFTAKAPGTNGNNIRVAYINPLANSQALSVVVTGYLITVNLATSAGGAITSTATLIAAAIAASASASALVSVALAGADTGAGVVTALAATNLTGGLE